MTSGAPVTKSTAVRAVPKFAFWLWTAIIVENWVFDFGRPVANFYFKLDDPRLPGIGDWFHLMYNIVTPYVLLLLLDRASRKIDESIKYLLIITFVLGASLHLVGDSIQARLVQAGFDLSISVRDNPVIKAGISNPKLAGIFELAYFYDEHLGHYLWYLPYFAAFLLFFTGCFISKSVKSSERERIPISGWLVLLPVGALFYWYLIVEGQVWPLFIFTFATIILLVALAYQRGEVLDVNGRFLFSMFSLTMVLFVAWVIYWRVPIDRLVAMDLDATPEFWEVNPTLTKLLIGG